MKKIIDLVGSKNKKIVSDSESFRYGMDSILLTKFVDVYQKDKLILDIGTGNGVIPLLLSEKTNAHIIGVEIQESSGSDAIESVKLNNKCDQIDIVIDDINTFFLASKPNLYDIITVNPPYFNSGKSTPRLSEQIARHEICLTVDNIFTIARKLLKNNAFLYIIYRTERLGDIFEVASKYNLAVKKISFVHDTVDKPAELCLVKCCKNGKSAGLIITEPIIVRNV